MSKLGVVCLVSLLTFNHSKFNFLNSHLVRDRPGALPEVRAETCGRTRRTIASPCRFAVRLCSLSSMSCDICTHTPAWKSSTNFILYPFVVQRCCTSWLWHWHGYEWHSPLYRTLRLTTSPGGRICVPCVTQCVETDVLCDYVRHRRNGYLAQRVPSPFLASRFRICLSCEVLEGMFPWRTRCQLS